MKKYVAILLAAMLFLCSCGTQQPKVVLPVPESTQSSAQMNENVSVKISIVDSVIEESLGEYIIGTEYSAETGRYMILMVMDGMSDAYGTREFKETCEALDSLSKTISDGIGLKNVIVLSSDKDIDICLYATDCGKDITHIFN